MAVPFRTVRSPQCHGSNGARCVTEAARPVPCPLSANTDTSAPCPGLQVERERSPSPSCLARARIRSPVVPFNGRPVTLTRLSPSREGKTMLCSISQQHPGSFAP
ncbi:hypothetical protein AAFF_G00218190 [Aldrovandia affinis]|uniref:Uncharacterized protein n=1 Tax=Aldrovandia affinis TaxID=143900 RepID=A0AAD7SW43_9TELE|nr:hypothetical protein AAFF_G00218190 [Aldrovandia affinis]